MKSDGEGMSAGRGGGGGGGKIAKTLVPRGVG